MRDMYLNVCVCDDLWAQKKILWLFRPNLCELGYFIQYFVCKYSFRKISMKKMVIWDQIKPISLYLKIKNPKLKNPKFISCTSIIHKNGNKTCIQPILKSNSTSFMFNKFFCEMKDEKVIHWGSWLNGEPS